MTTESFTLLLASGNRRCSGPWSEAGAWRIAVERSAARDVARRAAPQAQRAHANPASIGPGCEDQVVIAVDPHRGMQVIVPADRLQDRRRVELTIEDHEIKAMPFEIVDQRGRSPG